MNAKAFKYREKADGNWTLNGYDNGSLTTADAELAVLMDIREQLKKLNALFHCSKFVCIPITLSRIADNTAKPKRKRKTKPRGVK